ncbi:MBL fold metallo-hydrolase [Sutterella sp.]|uniref:MBL fold metallo-hydrolase n=1 Tax=Sutterella sp. TaxID=1981025 RepID=UPI0026DEDBBF|nr:MBL fold metallo-hydrolase [Sutterella sp.]MDO5532722.1 MBL fold metallo-hydrolase [Sutterella sp.]
MKFHQIRSATSIVTFGGVRFLIDPMLSPRDTYPAIPDAPVLGEGNPNCDLPCRPEDVLDVDAVIVTHLHFDHFDEAAARLLPKAMPLFTGGEAERTRLAGLGFTNVTVLTAGGVEFRGVRLFRTDCDHGSGSLTSRLAYAKIRETADACGVVFECPREAGRFYLAGDTVFCEYVTEAVRRYSPKWIAVNAAGAQYPRGHLIIMNEFEVLALMEMFPEVDVIATHVAGVSHATVTRESLGKFRAERGLARLAIPEDGEELLYG